MAWGTYKQCPGVAGRGKQIPSLVRIEGPRAAWLGGVDFFDAFDAVAV